MIWDTILIKWSVLSALALFLPRSISMSFNGFYDAKNNDSFTRQKFNGGQTKYMNRRNFFFPLFAIFRS